MEKIHDPMGRKNDPMGKKIFEEKVRDYCMNFLNDLIAQYPNESDFRLLICLMPHMNMEQIMKGFSDALLPVKPKIVKRDESFFLNNNCSIFRELDSGKVSHFQKLWTSPDLNDEGKTILWDWFSLFLTLTEKYQQMYLK